MKKIKSILTLIIATNLTIWMPYGLATEKLPKFRQVQQNIKYSGGDIYWGNNLQAKMEEDKRRQEREFYLQQLLILRQQQQMLRKSPNPSPQDEYNRYNKGVPQQPQSLKKNIQQPQQHLNPKFNDPPTFEPDNTGFFPKTCEYTEDDNQTLESVENPQFKPFEETKYLVFEFPQNNNGEELPTEPFNETADYVANFEEESLPKLWEN